MANSHPDASHATGVARTSFAVRGTTPSQAPSMAANAAARPVSCARRRHRRTTTSPRHHQWAVQYRHQHRASLHNTSRTTARIITAVTSPWQSIGAGAAGTATSKAWERLSVRCTAHSYSNNSSSSNRLQIRGHSRRIASISINTQTPSHDQIHRIRSAIRPAVTDKGPSTPCTSHNRRCHHRETAMISWVWRRQIKSIRLIS